MTKNLWPFLGIGAALTAWLYYMFSRHHHGVELLQLLAAQRWGEAIALARKHPGMLPEVQNLPWLIEAIVGTHAPKHVGKRGRQLAKVMTALEKKRKEVVSPGGLDPASWVHENQEDLRWVFHSDGHRAGLIAKGDLARVMRQGAMYETILTVLKAESQDPLLKDLLEAHDTKDACIWDGTAFHIQARYGLATYPVTHEGETYWKVDATRSPWLTTRITNETQAKVVELHGWLDQQRWRHPSTAIVMAWRHMLLLVNGRTPALVSDIRRKNREGVWWEP